MTGSEHIQITAYGDDSGRYERLAQTLAFAAGAASVKHLIPPRVFLRHLLGVHDHKGILSCLWDGLDAAFAFGSLLADAWGAQCECPDMVEHYCEAHGFLTRGRLGEDYKPTEWEHQQQWPGDPLPPPAAEIRIKF